MAILSIQKEVFIQVDFDKIIDAFASAKARRHLCKPISYKCIKLRTVLKSTIKLKWGTVLNLASETLRYASALS